MSGSDIGGFVGGSIGGSIGFMFGNPQLGYVIGSALGSSIGGYLDPTKVYGPRLGDSARQTSQVGVPLPFGYGTFTTAGNVIWSDDLKEHVKRQRQGKGGGAKTTTYTYTRSYAIGVCEGPIYGFLWIKRNGKTVYTTDPNAPAEDQKYSVEWIKRAAIYNGDELQMPDSTIEAVEGVGNVSPFRGLAYLVIENEDLTELAGAIPQYEFCVQASAPNVYLTSPPYPVISTDYAYSKSIDMPEYMGALHEFSGITSVTLVEGRLSEDIVNYASQPEHVDVSSIHMEHGLLVEPIRSLYITPEYCGAGIELKNGKLLIQLIEYSDANKEFVQFNIETKSGSIG